MNDFVYIIQTPPLWIKTPPLSLIYLYTYLKQKKIEARVIDLNSIIFKLLSLPATQWLTLDKQFEDTLFELVNQKFPFLIRNLISKIADAPFIGFPLLQRNTPFAFKLANHIKDRFPKKTIIFGGPNTLFLDKKNTLDPNYHWVIGEGETPLHKIIAGAKQHIYRFQEIENLDSLPFIDFDCIALNAYSPTIPLLSSRGCLFNCNFCSEKLLSKKFRHHSPNYLVEEIKHLTNKYQRNTFVFCDSMINYNQQTLTDFCSLIIKNNLSINWEAQIRITKNFPLELAKLMKQSGCYNLFIGLENGSDRVLQKMNKGFTTSDALEFFKIIHNAKLHFEISLILGYPGEDENDFQQTIDFIVKNKKIIPKIAQVNPFVDYLNDFPTITFPNISGHNRLKTLLNTFSQEKIRYTKSFIGNLYYQSPCK